MLPQCTILGAVSNLINLKVHDRQLKSPPAMPRCKLIFRCVYMHLFGAVKKDTRKESSSVSGTRVQRHADSAAPSCPLRSPLYRQSIFTLLVFGIGKAHILPHVSLKSFPIRVRTQNLHLKSRHIELRNWWAPAGRCEDCAIQINPRNI